MQHACRVDDAKACRKAEFRIVQEIIRRWDACYYINTPALVPSHTLIGVWDPIYKISYEYLKIIVRSTYDSDLKRAKIVSLRNIVS